MATFAVSRLSRHFTATYLTWGAINELSTLEGYRLLSRRTENPVLRELLRRIMRDEARHFAFYFRHAERRLARPGAAWIARLLVDRFWAPVGSGVAPAEETRFVAQHLFGDAEGRRAARRVDETIRRLPGFADVSLIEAFVERHAAAVPSCVSPLAA
jgi:hypothetical protein